MGTYSFHEIHLEYDQWENISEKSRRFYEYNHAKYERESRNLLLNEVIPSLLMIISSTLTPRQYQVISLYLMQYTQTKIAMLLGISQPTVSQHLNGKRRNHKKVGGTFRRIRRMIHQATRNHDIPDIDKETLALFNSLLEENMTRRKAATLLNQFSCAGTVCPSSIQNQTSVPIEL